MKNPEQLQEPKPEVTPDPRDAEIASLKHRLSRTVGAYRDSLVKLNPGLPAEMVGGDTLEALDESINRARSLVSKVRQSIEAERAASRVPAGAPLRGEARFPHYRPAKKFNTA